MLLGVSLAGANVTAAVLILLSASLAISGLGLMGAALILLYKRGNAVAWAVEAAMALLSGVFFPPQLLPAPLQKLSLLLPQTYALEGLRGTLLQGRSTLALLPDMGMLALFALALIPAGVLALRCAYRQAQVRGSLAQY